MCSMWKHVKLLSVLCIIQKFSTCFVCIYFHRTLSEMFFYFIMFLNTCRSMVVYTSVMVEQKQKHTNKIPGSYEFYFIKNRYVQVNILHGLIYDTHSVAPFLYTVDNVRKPILQESHILYGKVGH